MANELRNGMNQIAAEGETSTANFGRCRGRGIEARTMRGGSLARRSQILIQNGSRSEACSPRGVRDPLEPRSDLSGFISYVDLGMPRHHTARHKDVRARVREGAYLRGPPRRPPIRELCKPRSAPCNSPVEIALLYRLQDGSSIRYSLSATDDL